MHLNRKVLDHIIRLDSLIIDVDGAIVKGFPRIPVKKPSSILKIILERLGTGQDVEIVNHYAPAEIEEIVGQSLMPGMSSLLLTAMREWMLNRDPLEQSRYVAYPGIILTEFFLEDARDPDDYSVTSDASDASVTTDANTAGECDSKMIATPPCSAALPLLRLPAHPASCLPNAIRQQHLLEVIEVI